ncbi:TolC family outer membrane protein [Marinivivus vitaminiproducens]|uniref:TolC family outer membrane protein n=1 Tax=Marinivivus vitaminiproducens TaxID=3035935 RepID=UPI00279B743B|nr:TolC family outer membrane protein [Geminicoccaceae bacterium SCSIO 64248]
MSLGWIRRNAYSAVAVGLAGVLVSGPAWSQSLQDALVQSYLTNPQLDAARAELRAVDELAPQALSGWRPSASANAGFERSELDAESANASSSGGRFQNGSVNTRSYSLDLEQPLYQGGRTVANTRRAEALIRSQRANLRLTEQDVLLDAVTAYADVLADRATVELAENNRERLDRQLQATRDRFQVGEVTRTDVSQAEAALSNAVAEVVNAQGLTQTSEATYLQVIGRPAGSLANPGPLRSLPATEDEAQAMAEGFNPSIIAAEYALEASNYDVDVALAALKPTLSLSGQLAYSDEPSLTIDRQRSASVGVNLTVPLYQGGAEYSEVREAKQTVGQRQNDLDDAIRASRGEVTSAWEAVQTATALIQSRREAVRANEVALEGVRQEALVGARTVLDVLDAEQELFSSQVDLVDATRDQVIATYRLKAAIGQLNVTDLALNVEPYDSEIYYQRNRNRWFGLGSSTQ